MESWKGDNERADDQKGDLDGLHFDNLFDQNEDESGELYNLASGERIKNDQDIVDPSFGNKDELLTDKEIKKRINTNLKNDPGTKWLLDHGYNEDGSERKPN